MALKSDNAKMPRGFGEVALSRATRWTYWEIMSQPSWFLERYVMYVDAIEIVKKIESSKLSRANARMGSKLRR